MAVRRMGPGFDHKLYEAHRPQEAEDAFVTEFEGATLATFERNGYNDSDFFAIVWDEEQQSLRTVEYATTRGWTYPNSATPDATDEVLEKARRALVEQTLDLSTHTDRQRARRPEVGRKVRVTRGRTRGKHPVATGTEGWVSALTPGFKSGPVYSDWAKPEDNVALQVWAEDGSASLIYIGISRVEVVDPEQYETPLSELRERAERHAARAQVGESGGWRIAEAWIYQHLAVS